MPSWDSDPFRYLRRRAIGQIGGFDPLQSALPPPPPGFVYLLGADGAYLKGADGAYLLGAA